jgi:predicted Rossmann fold flavoprotein
MRSESRILIIGGGAAGFFAAVRCAEEAPGCEVFLLEKGSEFLQKVRISGGGRCNVTHACFDVREFVRAYPRGGKELLGPMHQFQARDTVEWFEARGVKLKTEKDGRMFPVTDNSETIVQCLLQAARSAGVILKQNCGVQTLKYQEGKFCAELANGEILYFQKVLLSIGGIRVPNLGHLAASLGHCIEPPVPSLFTFTLEERWVRELAGVSVPLVQVSLEGGKLAQRGPLLFTHAGLSGPAILRLSAWGARELHAVNYRFGVRIDWLPEISEEQVRHEFEQRRKIQGARLVGNIGFKSLSSRLWERLVENSGVSPTTRWSALSRSDALRLIQVLKGTTLQVAGKSLNKEEFVTCGGVRLSEVNFKTMQSRICPGLYFAGEVLDIDGVTGGFNFQAAWTTGWIAGKGMAESLRGEV